MDSSRDTNFVVIGKGVEDIYKHITDTFHPNAREVVTSAKAYLKALHGTSAASTLYLESLQRFTNSCKGFDEEIGNNLEKVTSAFRELHFVQAKQIKHLYVDLIQPLESNLEKDVKLVGASLKKFVQGSKGKLESYGKCANTIKKKNRNFDKEIKGLQSYHEERAKVELFFEQARSEAVGLARRRYTFILERQLSVSKKTLLYCEKGVDLLSDLEEISPSSTFDCSCSNNKKKRKVRALYNYQGNGDQFLAFEEGDTLLLLISETPKKGWEYGENPKTNKSGWFPSAYVSDETNNEMQPPALMPPPVPLIRENQIYAALNKSTNSLTYPTSSEDSGINHHSPALTIPDVDYDSDNHTFDQPPPPPPPPSYPQIATPSETTPPQKKKKNLHRSSSFLLGSIRTLSNKFRASTTKSLSVVWNEEEESSDEDNWEHDTIENDSVFERPINTFNGFGNKRVDLKRSESLLSNHLLISVRGRRAGHNQWYDLWGEDASCNK